MSDKIKIGIWGLGRAGFAMHRTELENYQDKYDIVAVCDIDPERCENFKSKVDCRTYTDIAEFLADDEMELVSIATRSSDHVEHAGLALEAGKIIFLEKPIAVSHADLIILRQLLKQYPERIYFRHNRRFESAFVHIREIIASGILGDVYEIKLRRNSYQLRDDWQTLIACDGGQLNNWGPHLVDHAMQFLESPCREIWSKLNLIAALGDAEDFLKIIFVGENDRIIDVEINGGAAMKEPVYIVSGSRGMLKTDDEKVLELRYMDPEFQPEGKASAETPPIGGGFGNNGVIKWIEEERQVAPSTGDQPHSIWKYLYAAIKDGVPFPITAEEALKNAEIIIDIKSSSAFAGSRS